MKSLKKYTMFDLMQEITTRDFEAREEVNKLQKEYDTYKDQPEKALEISHKAYHIMNDIYSLYLWLDLIHEKDETCKFLMAYKECFDRLANINNDLLNLIEKKDLIEKKEEKQ